MPSRRVERIVLIALTAFMGLVAVPSGLVLDTGRAESLFGMDEALLVGSPFGSYLIPGIILAPAVGGSLLLATIALLRRSAWGAAAAVVAGCILMGWIAVELVIVGWVGLWWWQPAYFLYGLLVAWLALRQFMADRPGMAARWHLPLLPDA